MNIMKKKNCFSIFFRKNQPNKKFFKKQNKKNKREIKALIYQLNRFHKNINE